MHVIITMINLICACHHNNVERVIFVSITVILTYVHVNIHCRIHNLCKQVCYFDKYICYFNIDISVIVTNDLIAIITKLYMSGGMQQYDIVFVTLIILFYLCIPAKRTINNIPVALATIHACYNYSYSYM